MVMVRKQFYIERWQDEKLKRIAAARGCTESAVVRDAIDRLAEVNPPKERAS
jgi:hypothetical protein